MNIKFISIFIIALLVILPLSGCFEKKESIEFKPKIIDKLFPVGKIISPKTAYFEENIEFDASESYDDGEIELYSWDFGDGFKSEGKTVSHIYKFEYDFTIDYPIIYPISLSVIDNDGLAKITYSYISIYPDRYIFYLKDNQIFTENQVFNELEIKPSYGIFRSNNITFESNFPVNISACNWNISFNVKKPLMLKLKSINVRLTNEKNQEISKAEYIFSTVRFWTEKNIQLIGEINSKNNLKYITLEFFGFSLFNKIKISQGGDNPINICFDFRN